MSIVVSKAAVHCIGPRRKDYGNFLNTINTADRRMPVVKCRDDFGATDEPLALWPETICIGAKTDWDDADYNVETAYQRIVALKEYYNERDGDYKQQADLYIALLPCLKEAGIGLVMFNCASGTPKYPSQQQQTIGYKVRSFASKFVASAAPAIDYDEIARACKFAKGGGYDALLGVHEYWTPGGTTAAGDPNTVGRFKTLADYLDVHGALIPIVVTEWAFETHPGDETFMAFVRAAEAVYQADPRVLGCAAFTLGGSGWGDSNYETALPAMADHIATVEAVPVPPVTQYVFDHWLDMTTGANLGTANPLTLVIEGDRIIQAVFAPKVAPPTTCVCLTSVTPDGAGVVTGGGTYNAGDTVTLTATAA
jgi:hypothetical protein